MPAETTDIRFQYIATFKEQIGDNAYINIKGIRLYDIEVTFLPNQPLRAAIALAHGFCSALDIVEDFISFSAFLRAVPLAIPKGYSLPVAEFMNSPFVDIEYHTFEADYFLYSVSQKPYVHVETGFELPLSLSAQLVIDATIIYRKIPLHKRPEVPYNHTRVLLDDGFAVDFPDEGTYSFSQAVKEAFGRYTSGTYYSYFLYMDCCQFYDGVVFSEEEQESSALYAHGIKTDGNGRAYYWGTDNPSYPLFPYRSIEPIPGANNYLYVSYGYESVEGFIRGYTSPEYIIAYPPEGQDPLVKIGRIPLIEALAHALPLFSAKVFFRERIEDLLLDGSWRVGYGGLSVGGKK